jgi:hypothetical protein
MLLLQGDVSWFRNGVLRVLAGAWNIPSSHSKFCLQSGGYRPWKPRYQPPSSPVSAYMTLCSPPYGSLLMTISRECSLRVVSVCHSYRNRNIHLKFHQVVIHVLRATLVATSIRSALTRAIRRHIPEDVIFRVLIVCNFLHSESLQNRDDAEE